MLEDLSKYKQLLKYNRTTPLKVIKRALMGTNLLSIRTEGRELAQRSTNSQLTDLYSTLQAN